MFIFVQLDPSLADLVMEMGYSICSSLEECRRNLLSVISGNGSSDIFGSLSIAKVLSMMIRTHTGLDTQSNLTYWPGDNANNDQDKSSTNCTAWNVDVFVHTVKDLVLIYCFNFTFLQSYCEYYINIFICIYIVESIIILVRCHQRT